MITPEVEEVSGVQAGRQTGRSGERSTAIPSREFIRAVAELLETDPDNILADWEAAEPNEPRRADALSADLGDGAAVVLRM